MRQVFLEKGTVCVQNVARPQLNPWSVLVSVHYSFVSSGMEASAIAHAKKNPLFSNVPHKIKMVLATLSGQKAIASGRTKKAHTDCFQALGNSCSGQIIAVGEKVTAFRPGDYVACAGAEFAHHADIVCVPESLVVRVSQETLKESSATALGAVALQAIRRSSLQVGETVCVLGLGLLGQLTVQMAKIAGCKVIGIDLLEDRLTVAKNLGADATFLAQSENLYESINFLTQGHGVDCSLITASGKGNDIVQTAMNITRRRGKVVVVGEVGLGLEREPFYKKEIDLLTSHLYGPGFSEDVYEKEKREYPHSYVRWTEKRNMEAVASLIQQRKLTVNLLAEKEFSIDDADKAYQVIQNKQAIGVILSYSHQKNVSFVPATKEKDFSKKILFPSLEKEVLRVGVVGAGDESKNVLLPILNKRADAEITAISDTSIVAAKNAAHQVGAKKTFTDEVELFSQSDVDVVCINSSHKLNFDQALQALVHKKAVFLHKPMMASFHQFNIFNKFLLMHPEAPVCVNYHRSFAPFIEKIKWETVDRYSPLVIQYRINNAREDSELWNGTEQSAGNIINDACHIFDLFCFLTGAKPVALSVESLKPKSDDLFPTDNFSVHVSFNDGSICSLLYTSLGHSASGMERMEVFFDAKSIVMDDYRVLKGFGTSRAFDETVLFPDKGEAHLLEKFFERLKIERFVSPVSLDRFRDVAQLTLITDQLVCEGGGTTEFSSQSVAREVGASREV